MPPNTRLILFINAAHALCHYCLLILPTAVLAIAARAARSARATGPSWRWRPACSCSTACCRCRRAGSRRATAGTGSSPATSSARAPRWWRAAFAETPLVLGLSLAAAGAFAAIYHPIGTAMLVDAAGERPGRALGTNGVFGNLGVASAPVLTAALSVRFGWHSAFILPGLVFVAVGAAWTRVPELDPDQRPRRAPVPRHPAGHRAPGRHRAAARRRRVGPGVQRVHHADPQADAGAAGRRGPAAGRRRRLCSPRCAEPMTQFTVGRLIDRATLKRVLLPVSLVLVPGLASLAFVQGWLVVPGAGLVSAAIFGQVTLNETMTARYISPALRARMYSIRFFMGFLGERGGRAARRLPAREHRLADDADAGPRRLQPGHAGLRGLLSRPAGGTAGRAEVERRRRRAGRRRPMIHSARAVRGHSKQTCPRSLAPRKPAR